MVTVKAKKNAFEIKPGTALLPGLARIRRERDLSLRELAAKAGLTTDTVWRLEDLQRGAEQRTRRKLAAALGTTVRELRTPDKEVMGTSQ